MRASVQLPALFDLGEQKESLRRHQAVLAASFDASEREGLVLLTLPGSEAAPPLPMTVFELEQCIASGVDSSGAVVKPDKVEPAAVCVRV